MPKSAPSIQQEQRFRSLFENSLDLVLFQDRAGVVLDINKAFLTLLHATKAAVVGHPLAEFLPLELRPLFARKLTAAFAGRSEGFVANVQFRGAEQRLLSFTKVPFVVDGAVQGVHLAARDIAELTASHDLVDHHARQLNAVFDSISDGVLMIDRHWRVTFLNQVMTARIGQRREQVLGQRLEDVFPDEVDGEFAHYYRQAMRTGEPARFEAFHAKGRRWVDVKIFPSAEGLAVYSVDVTARKDAEAAQAQLSNDLYQHNQDLQQFTYIVSHNLRQPLANALGLVQMLAAQEREQGPLMGYLQTSLQQLDDVLHDLNVILAVRDRQDAQPAESVGLAELLRQVLRSLSATLQQVGGQVRLELPENLLVYGTRAYLYSIFYNLLSNAIKYRHPQRPLQITVAGVPRPECGARVTVADNGSGFDRQKAGADVFKLYKRFHATPEGRGLGLYLIYTHLEAMGGRIEVTSQPDVGTEFTLSLA